MPETTHSTNLRTDGTLQLPLPALSQLSDRQRRGADSAWCRMALTTETADDAGERPATDGGQLFPRGCWECAARAAHRLLWEHCPACNVCRTNPTCPTATAAQRIMREGGL